MPFESKGRDRSPLGSGAGSIETAPHPATPRDDTWVSKRPEPNLHNPKIDQSDSGTSAPRCALRHSCAVARPTTAPHGMTSAEVRRLNGAVRFTGLYSKRGQRGLRRATTTAEAKILKSKTAPAISISRGYIGTCAVPLGKSQACRPFKSSSAAGQAPQAENRRP
jgi:hypothetical protein